MGRLRGRTRTGKSRSGEHRKSRFMVMLLVGNNEFADIDINAGVTGVFGDRGQRPLHITLYGPFTIHVGAEAELVLRRVESAAPQSGSLRYNVSGLLRLRGRKGSAIALRVNPSPGLEQCYERLSASLLPMIAKGTWIDRRPRLRQLHVTLALNLKAGDADRIWESVASGYHVDTLPKTYGSSMISVFKNGTFWKEYDIHGRCWHDRAASFGIRNAARRD